MSRRPLARIRDLAVGFATAEGPVGALAGVSLELLSGERLAVIGESGSGKSTLALALAGLLGRESRITGAIDWPDGAPRPGRDVGLVFQDPGGSFDPVMTVGDQIAEVATIHLGLSRREARRRAVELLTRMRFEAPERVAASFPHQLSGGQKQRAALAAALAAAPRLLIADEATSALDTVVQAEIVALIDRLVRDDGTTLLFVTHDIALAATLGDRIAVLYAGTLVEIGPATDVATMPLHPYTRALIAAQIRLDGPLVRPLAVIPGSPPDPWLPTAGCAFAPRCREAGADCAVAPVLRIDGDRGVACHRAEPAGGTR